MGVAVLELLHAAEGGEEVVAEVVGAVQEAGVGVVGREPGVRYGFCKVDGVRSEEHEEDISVGGVELFAGKE